MSARTSLLRPILRWLVDSRWFVLRVLVWIGGTVLVGVERGWLLGAAIFVFVGGPFWIWATVGLLIWRRQRRREREGTEVTP